MGCTNFYPQHSPPEVHVIYSFADMRVHCSDTLLRPTWHRHWAKYLMFIFSFNNNLEEYVCLLIIYISVFNPLSIFSLWV